MKDKTYKIFFILIVIFIIGCNKNELYNKEIRDFFEKHNVNCSRIAPWLFDCRVDICNPFDNYGNLSCIFGIYDYIDYDSVPNRFEGIDTNGKPIWIYGESSLKIRLYGFYLTNETIECHQIYEIGKCPHNTTFIDLIHENGTKEKIEIC